MITWSPVSRWGAKIGLRLPRRMLATSVARRPSTMPSASTTYQARSISEIFGLYVGTRRPLHLRTGFLRGARERGAQLVRNSGSPERRKRLPVVGPVRQGGPAPAPAAGRPAQQTAHLNRQPVGAGGPEEAQDERRVPPPRVRVGAGAGGGERGEAGHHEEAGGRQVPGRGELAPGHEQPGDAAGDEQPEHVAAARHLPVLRTPDRAEQHPQGHPYAEESRRSNARGHTPTV